MTRAAYQLDLLGAKPRKAKEWMPTLYVWSFCGLAIPPSDDAKRQAEMLTRETRDLTENPGSGRSGERP